MDTVAIVGADGSYVQYELHGTFEPIMQGRIHHSGVATSIVIVAETLVIGFDRGLSYYIVDFDNTDKAAVSKLEFKIDNPPQVPTDALFTLAVADCQRPVLWIANYLRSSVMAVSINTHTHQFNRSFEFPIAALGHIALATYVQLPKAQRSISFFYKHASGFSQAIIHEPETYLDKLLVEDEEQAQAQSEPEPELEPEQEQEPQVELTVKAPGQDELPAPFSRRKTLHTAESKAQEEVKAATPTQRKEITPEPSTSIENVDVNNDSIAQFEFILQRELRILGKNQVTQMEKLKLASQVDDIERQQTLVRLVSDALDHDVKAHLQRVIQEEIQARIVPSTEKIVKESIKKATGDKLAIAINEGIERNINALIQKDVVPKLTEVVSSIPQTIGALVSAEMNIIRKDLLAEQDARDKQTASVFSTLVGAVSSLTNEVKALQEQLASIRSGTASTAPLAVSAPPVTVSRQENFGIKASDTINGDGLVKSSTLILPLVSLSQLQDPSIYFPAVQHAATNTTSCLVIIFHGPLVRSLSPTANWQHMQTFLGAIYGAAAQVAANLDRILMDVDVWVEGLALSDRKGEVGVTDGLRRKVQGSGGHVWVTAGDEMGK